MSLLESSAFTMVSVSGTASLHFLLDGLIHALECLFLNARNCLIHVSIWIMSAVALFCELHYVES